MLQLGVNVVLGPGRPGSSHGNSSTHTSFCFSMKFFPEKKKNRSFLAKPLRGSFLLKFKLKGNDLPLDLRALN